MEEIWKLIPNSKNYEVSNFGRVRKVYKSNTYKEIKGYKSKNGYVHIWFKTVEGEIKRDLLHRLVAKLFIPHTSEEWMVKHKNNDLSNNNVNNLYWVKANLFKRLYQQNWIKNKLEK